MKLPDEIKAEIEVAMLPGDRPLVNYVIQNVVRHCAKLAKQHDALGKTDEAILREFGLE